MEWELKSKESADNAEKAHTRAEIVAMIFSDRIRFTDLIRKTGEAEPWRPLFSVPEVTAPLKSFMSGIRYFENKRFDMALNAFSSSITVPQLFIQSSFFMGIIHSFRDNFERAVHFYKNCREIPFLSKLVRNNIAVCYAYIDKIQDAHNELFVIATEEVSYFNPIKRIRKLFERVDLIDLPDKKIEKKIQMNLHFIRELARRDNIALTFHTAEDNQENEGSENNQTDEQVGEQDVTAMHEKYVKNMLPDELIGIDKIASMKSLLYEYFMIIDPALYYEIRKFSVPEPEAEKVFLHFGRYQEGLDLFEKEKMEEAQSVFRELTMHENISGQAERMIQKCDFAIEKKMLLQYREFKNLKEYENALALLMVFREKYANTTCLNINQEINAINTYLNIEKINDAVNWICNKHQNITSRYEKTLKTENINLHELVSVKIEGERILSNAERFADLKNDYFNSILKEIKTCVEKSIEDIKNYIINDLETCLEQKHYIEYIDKIGTYEAKEENLCKYAGIDPDNYYEKAVESIWNHFSHLEKKRDKGNLTLADINSFFLMLNSLINRLQTNDKLKEIRDKAVSSMVFAQSFSGRFEESDMSIILDSFDVIQRQNYQSRYFVEKELLALDETRNNYLNDGIEGLQNDLNRLCRFKDKNKEFAKRIIAHLISLADFFENHNDFEKALLVIDVITKRMGIESNVLEKRKSHYNYNLKLEKISSYLEELTKLYEKYKDNALQAKKGGLTEENIKNLINQYDKDIQKFAIYSGIIGDKAGFSIEGRRVEIGNFFQVIQMEFDNLLLRKVKNDSGKINGKIKDETIEAALEYCKNHSRNFFERVEIRNILEQIINKKSSARGAKEQELLEKTGISTEDLYCKLSAIFSADDTVQKEILLKEIERQKLPDNLLLMIRNYSDRIKKKRLSEKLKLLFKDAKENIDDKLTGTLDGIYKIVYDPENKNHIIAETKYKFSEYLNKSVDFCLKSLIDLFNRNPVNNRPVDLFLSKLPGFLKDAVINDARYDELIKPRLKLNQLAGKLKEYKGQILKIPETEFTEMVKDLISISSLQPKEVKRLRDILEEEIYKISDDDIRKENYIQILRN